MRLLMGIIRDRHGTYYARKKVPPHLQEALALVLSGDVPCVRPGAFGQPEEREGVGL
jgi:hypothetical protein